MEFGKELAELGLSMNESKAYVTLIEHGKLSASEVCSRSGVPYGRVYEVLEGLVHRALIVVVPEKTKKYAPASPDAFLELIDKKEEILKEARNKVKQMKQFYEEKGKNAVQIALGDKGFYKIIKEAKKEEKYAYNIKWKADFKPEWVRNTEKHLKEGVDMKTLTRYDAETKKNVDQWIGVHKGIKKISNEGVAFSVVDDEEVMIALIKSDTTLLIRDKPFAKLMKKMFLATYNQAEQIK